jgi:hypothetical protein
LGGENSKMVVQWSPRIPGPSFCGQFAQPPKLQSNLLRISEFGSLGIAYQFYSHHDLTAIIRYRYQASTEAHGFVFAGSGLSSGPGNSVLRLSSKNYRNPKEGIDAFRTHQIRMIS